MQSAVAQLIKSRYCRIFWLVFACLTLTSCSLRWSYNFLDWLVAWEVDEYVNLDRQQKKQLNKDIDKFHRWHRQTQLPLYADFLQQLEHQLLDSDANSEQLMQSFDRASQLWQDALIEFTAPAPELFREFSEQQIAELIKNTTEETDAAYEKYMGREEVEARAKQRKHMAKRLKKWLGELSEQQNSLLDQWSLDVSTNHKLMVAARKQWQQQFDQTLQLRNSENFDTEIQTLLVFPDKLWSDNYRASVKKNQQITMQLFADMSHSLSSKQQQKLRKKLRGYIGDFQYLAKK